MFWDSTYILALIGAAVCAIASLNVNRTYKKYNGVLSGRGLTAEAVAEMILRRAGIYDVRIERVSGSLTDYYSPGEKVLKLSESVYGSTSVAAIGVAAHECGHAIQHSVGYFPLKLRSAAVPVASIGSKIYWPVILLGLAATAFHFAVLRCPHCGKHLGRERGDTCPHCGKPLTEKDDTDPAAR